MAKNIIPRGCYVRRAELNGKGGAEIGYACAGESGADWFPDGHGGGSNYRSKKLKRITSIELDGATVTGHARVGFVISPRAATCTRDGSALRCKVK